MKLVDCDVRDSIALLTLKNPAKKNPLSLVVLDEILSHLVAAGSVGAKVAVVRGSGDSFSAGYNLDPSSRVDYAGASGIVNDVAQLQRLADRLKAIRQSPLPLLSQVHGYCFAGGTDLMLASDIAIAASDARIGVPNVRSLGISLLSTLWPLHMGPMRAKMMMLTGDWISGAQAEQWGLVGLSVPAGELEQSVMALAQRIALLPTDLAQSVKRATNRAFDTVGVDQLVAAAVEIDTIAHFSAPVVHFWQSAREAGLKSALKAREAPFQGSVLAGLLARTSCTKETSE